MSNKSLSVRSSTPTRVKQARRRARAELLAEVLLRLSPALGGRRRGWFTRRIGARARARRWGGELDGGMRAVCRKIGWGR